MKSPLGVNLASKYDFIGQFGFDGGGPFYRIFLKLEGSVIVSMGFSTISCPWAIAIGSATTALVVGLDCSKALNVNEQQIVEELGGIPRDKRILLMFIRHALHDGLNKALNSSPIMKEAQSES
ncbi:MAG TPA: iron-sulfur cluster assembly scaffold protein [Candidatus Paceibacterota bacterium]|nr:iron-sulfur cluster assembly scaffold protein [Candidatus Paceibacterota bacterium]